MTKNNRCIYFGYMEKTVLNVKTDKEVKQRAQSLAKHIGVPLSTVVNAYLKEFVSSGEFRIAREPQLKPKVSEELEIAIKEVRAGKNVSPRFKDAEKAIEWLKK